MALWRTFECRGRDPNDNPFGDFGFVEVSGEHLAHEASCAPGAALGGQRTVGYATFQMRQHSRGLLEAALQGFVAGRGACRRPL
jgi:hypothetical protein